MRTPETHQVPDSLIDAAPDWAKEVPCKDRRIWAWAWDGHGKPKAIKLLSDETHVIDSEEPLQFGIVGKEDIPVHHPFWITQSSASTLSDFLVSDIQNNFCLNDDGAELISVRQAMGCWFTNRFSL